MSGESGSAGFQLGDWRVEVALGSISRDSDRIRIDPRNMKVLQLLASRPGELVTQAEIETAVWSGLVVTTNSVYQSVAQLRRALGDDRTHPRYIETIPRKGYRLIAPVHTLPALAPPRYEEPVVEPSAAPAKTESISFTHRTSRMTGIAASLIAFAVAAAGYALYDRSRSTTAAIGVPQFGAGPANTLDASPLNDSAVRASMHFTLASQAWSQGQYEAARRHLELASIAQRDVSGYRHPNMAVILAELANARRWGGDYAAAELLAREATRILAATVGMHNAERLRATIVLGDTLIDGEKYDEAAIYVERALSDARTLYGEGHDLTLDAQHSLALLRLSQGRLDDAEQIARRTSEGYSKLHREQIVSKYPYALALVLYEQGRYAEAAAEARRQIDQLSRMTPRHPGYIAVAQHFLGRSLNKLGRCEEAESVFRTEIQDWKETSAPRWRIARASSGLGESLLGQGRLEEAEEQLTFAARELAGARGWLPRKALQSTQERLEQLREARRTQQTQHAQVRETN